MEISLENSFTHKYLYSLVSSARKKVVHKATSWINLTYILVQQENLDKNKIFFYIVELDAFEDFYKHALNLLKEV